MLPWPKVDFSKFGEVEEVELGRIQKISGANLSRNWVMIPHVTHFDKTDITDLEAFRKQQNAEAEAQTGCEIHASGLHHESGCRCSGTDAALQQLSVRRRSASDPEEIHQHRRGG